MSCWYVRFALYVFVVSYLCSRLTYISTHFNPDRPPSPEHVALVGVVGCLATSALIALEYAVPKKKWSVVLCSLGLVLLIGLGIESLMWDDVEIRCKTSVSVVGLAYSDSDAWALRHEWGEDLFVVRGLEHENQSALNLTRARGIERRVPESQLEDLIHLMSTYDLLKQMSVGEVNWVVVLEPTARLRPKFLPRMFGAICRHEKSDVIWLHASVLWDTETTGMVYKRLSLPRVLHWLDLDADERRTSVALRDMLSEGCASGQLECAAAALVRRSSQLP